MNQHQPDNRLVPVQESDRIRYIQFSERMFVPPQQIAPCKPQRNCRGCIHPINPCTTDNGICYFSSHTAMPASRITGCVGVCAVTPEEMEKRLQDAKQQTRDEILKQSTSAIMLIMAMCQGRYRYDQIMGTAENAIVLLESLKYPWQPEKQATRKEPLTDKIDKFASDLTEWIEKNTTWESYGYYGPLVYTGPLLEEIEKLRQKSQETTS